MCVQEKLYWQRVNGSGDSFYGCFFFLKLAFSWHLYHWEGLSKSSMVVTKVVKQSSVSAAERNWRAARWVEIPGGSEPSPKRKHSRKVGSSCKISRHFRGWDLTKNYLSLGKVIKHSDNYFDSLVKIRGYGMLCDLSLHLLLCIIVVLLNSA